MVGVLVATDPASGEQFGVQFDRMFLSGLTAETCTSTSCTPESGNVAWVAPPRSAPVSVATAMEMQLVDSTHISLPVFPPLPTTGGSSNLHVNCGTWTPEQGPGAMVVGLGMNRVTSSAENAWTMNDDSTISPVINNVPALDYVLAWGTFRWAPCLSTQPTGDGTTRLTLEFANDTSAIKFYFRATQPAPPLPPLASPPPLNTEEVWVEQCCANGALGAQEARAAATPFASFHAAMQRNLGTYLASDLTAANAYYGAQRARAETAASAG
jgi:hypothetical protein